MDDNNKIIKALIRLTRDKPEPFLERMCRQPISHILDAEESREVSMKPSQTVLSKSSALTIEVVARPVPADTGTGSLCCPGCHIPLDLHQPDEELPSQLLGTCEWCLKWFFLVEIDADWNGSFLFELPGADDIRALMAAPASASVV
jgi:hypothetical protein